MAAGAELIQKAWESLGIEVRPKAADGPGLSSAALRLRRAGRLGGPGRAQVTDPARAVHVRAHAPPGGGNFAGMDNAQYQALVQKASAKVATAGCPQRLRAEQVCATTAKIGGAT